MTGLLARLEYQRELRTLNTADLWMVRLRRHTRLLMGWYRVVP